ncbi:endolytic transglycosylase MltG [Luteipulveratus flavus]|uniref:Endolytic murein transglycosylase n=1 Tax=Luteipulveratus flavus TaxID=3031728 RepID=A0ABT6C620_9MICO|nr:endolytic transglycosylase MltG [Luteipulveratus sp. YIM 133296]MDF8264171.1 endolytic transglycosylase MltG [Luteipulveratus sp. YIM 133296]
MNEPHLSDSIFGGDGDETVVGAAGSGSGDDASYQPGGYAAPASRREARENADRQAVQAPEDSWVEYGDPPRRRRRPWLPLLLALVLVGAGGFVAFKALGPSLPSWGGGGSQTAGADYTGTGSGSAVITVRRGDTGSQIGAALEKAGVVKSGNRFAQAFAAEPQAARLQPGSYTLRRQMSSSAALQLMLDPSARKGGVTIPEGLWATEIYARLSKATGTPLADYSAVDAAALDLPEGANGRVEGYLFPSTYLFADGATATDQLRTMVAEFKRRTASLNIPADQVSRVMTIASIVQAESKLGQDGPKVARVIENRLKPNPATNGRLQMDSTIHYLHKKRGTVTTSDKERDSTSPYNTYKHAGLPPAPVDNPGIEAIKAAQSPAPGSWLYFVTVNQQTGETRFSSTLAEHNKNVALFRAWCKANPGRC